LARAIYSPPAAWITGLVVALYPALTSGVLAWGTMTEPLYLLWVGVAIYALYLALERGRTATMRCWAARWGWPT
jgi:hypothetical protein